MARAMNDYPETSAILVRRHGIYVWGQTWQSAKSMCECYDVRFFYSSNFLESIVNNND